MKQIRVKALFGNHTIYQEMVNYPPASIKYIGVGRLVRRGKYYERKIVKEKASQMFRILRLPRILLIFPTNADLIHSSRGILPLQLIKKKPWVIDIEHPFSFTHINPKLLRNKFTRKIVENFLSSKYCKKIMPHCEASKKALVKVLDCSKFKNKIEVVYPATHIIEIKKKPHKKIRILSVLSLFYEKGGLQVLEAFSRLEKKYKNIELWIKADVPEKIKRRYNSKNIKYFPYKKEILLREKLLQKYYAQCDIFLYPTFYDTLGYSLLDAMVCKLPIVASNNFAVPEIVENGKNGFVVKLPFSCTENLEKLKVIKRNKIYPSFINKLVNKLSLLIKDKKLREKMGKYSFYLVSEGKFSIKERNKQLRKIYEDALK